MVTLPCGLFSAVSQENPKGHRSKAAATGGAFAVMVMVRMMAIVTVKVTVKVMMMSAKDNQPALYCS